MRSTPLCPPVTSNSVVSSRPFPSQMYQLQLSSPAQSASSHPSGASSTAHLSLRRTRSQAESEYEDALEEIPSPSDGRPSSLFTVSSSATLVHHEPLKLVFSRDSVVNTTLYHHGAARYQIASNTSMTNITVHDVAAQRVVAAIKYRYFWPDVVVLPHRGSPRKSIRIGKWLRRPTREDDVRSVASLRTETGCYSWRSCNIYRLALYPEKSCDDTPVAHCVPSERWRNMTLIIQSTAFDIIVDIIVSFLVLEQRLRMKEYQDRYWDTQYLASSVILM